MKSYTKFQFYEKKYKKGMLFPYFAFDNQSLNKKSIILTCNTGRLRYLLLIPQRGGGVFRKPEIKLSKRESQLIEEFANCYDVVTSMPKFLYRKYQLGDLKLTVVQIGRDLKRYLSTNRDWKDAENIISNHASEIKRRRQDFGQYEVLPYFNRKILISLMELHKKALDEAILTVLSYEDILKIHGEELENIKKNIWLGLELDTYSMLGGIEITDDVFSYDLVEKISKECVKILYSQLEEFEKEENIKVKREILLRQILEVIDLKRKISIYNLDEDLWRFFTVIEAVRLLDVTGEFVHDLIELSILLRKIEGIEEEIVAEEE